MPSRVRTQSRTFGSSGSWHGSNGTSGVYLPGQAVSTCQDYHGEFPRPNNFNVEYNPDFLGSVSGTVNLGGTLFTVSNYPVALNRYAFGSGVDPSMSASDMTSHALAVANPSRPIVDLGSIAQDIWEFPRLCKDLLSIGYGVLREPSLIYKESGSHYLENQFGALPIIQDLYTALDFVDSVKKREPLLQTLHDTGGIRRTTKFGAHGHKDTGDSSTRHFYVGGQGWAVDAYVRAHWYRRDWVSTHYKLDADSPLKLDYSGQDVANSLLGLNPVNAAFQIYQLMPWTWLIDWFENVRDLFRADNNSLGVHCDYSCLMTTEGVEVEGFFFNPGVGLVGTPYGPFPGGCTKTRIVTPNPEPSLSFSIPLLGGDQLSILAALTQSRTWTGR